MRKDLKSEQFLLQLFEDDVFQRINRVLENNVKKCGTLVVVSCLQTRKLMLEGSRCKQKSFEKRLTKASS